MEEAAGGENSLRERLGNAWPVVFIISSLQYDKAFLFLEKEWHVCVCACVHACSVTSSSLQPYGL